MRALQHQHEVLRRTLQGVQPSQGTQPPQVPRPPAATVEEVPEQGPSGFGDDA